MAPDSIIVMDDARRMVGDIIETYSHGGATFAKVDVVADSASSSPESGDTADEVRTGPGQTDFVELPDNPETANYLLYCHECGHPEEQDDGSTEQVGERERVCAHEGSARVLRRIHEAKHGHADATVLPTAERAA
jgi:hypothetical protein